MAEPDLTYEPELTELVIVDSYNDFLSEGGKLYDLSRATLEAFDVIEHMRQVIAAARARGMQVFVAPHHRWREGDLHSQWKTALPIQAPSAKARVFADGTWGGTVTRISNLARARWSHRSIALLAAVALTTTLLAGSNREAAPQTAPRTGIKNVVLVHGAFADGSGWEGVTKILEKDGYTVSVAQPPETSYAEDVKYAKAAVDARPPRIDQSIRSRNA